MEFLIALLVSANNSFLASKLLFERRKLRCEKESRVLFKENATSATDKLDFSLRKSPNLF